jgi:hypothetical protein
MTSIPTYIIAGLITIYGMLLNESGFWREYCISCHLVALGVYSCTSIIGFTGFGELGVFDQLVI